MNKKKNKRISKKAKTQNHAKDKVVKPKNHNLTKDETSAILNVIFAICSTLATTGNNHLTLMFFGNCGIYTEIILVIIFNIIAAIGRRKYKKGKVQRKS